MYGSAPHSSNITLVVSLGVAMGLACVVLGINASPSQGRSARPLRFNRIQIDPITVPDPAGAESREGVFAGQPCWSRGSTVNIRSGPSTGHAKVGSVSDGTPLRCTKTEGRWHAVNGAGRGGFIRGDLLRWEPPATYEQHVNRASAMEARKDYQGAWRAWVEAAEIGQDASDAWAILPDALFKGALDRVRDKGGSSALSSSYSERNQLEATMTCREGVPEAETVYTLYRALEIKNLPSPVPTFFVTTGGERSPWVAIHLEGDGYRAAGGMVYSVGGTDPCVVRTVLTVSWREHLSSSTLEALSRHAAVERLAMVSM